MTLRSLSPYALAVAVILFVTLPVCAHAKDKTIDYATGDLAMNAAGAAARKTLPGFWDTFAAARAGDSGFSIKVRIPYGNSGEHFWTSDVERSGDVIHARIANDPNYATSVKKGQRIEVDPAAISDWMFWRNGRIHGGYTLRAMLPRLSKKQAGEWRVRLAPLPEAEGN